MKKTFYKSYLLFAFALITTACNSQLNSGEIGLKDAMEGKFLMGTAMNAPMILGADTASLNILHGHFNSIVAENVMKSGPIQPVEGEFSFDLSDRFIAFGEQNDLYIVGHCLIWHSQAPRWLFVDEEGNDVSSEVLKERMKTHISTVVERYKGKVDCWDVVNEAIEDDGSWRNNKFYQILGEEYVELAFSYAQEIDPDAEFLYNDYSTHNKGKREGIVRLVEDLKAKGLKVDAIGMQAHSGMDHPALAEFEKSLIAFSETGCDVHITEMDITSIPFPDRRVGADVSASFEYQEKMNPYANGLTDSARVALHDRYLDFFKLFLKHEDKIKRVTLWGVSDQQSWRNNWPIKGRMDFPLLFDREYQAKPVLTDIIDAAL